MRHLEKRLLFVSDVHKKSLSTNANYNNSLNSESEFSF